MFYVLLLFILFIIRVYILDLVIDIFGSKNFDL